MKKVIQEVLITISKELYDGLEEIQKAAHFKDMDQTIGWLMNTTNDFLADQDNRDFLAKRMTKQEDGE